MGCFGSKADPVDTYSPDKPDRGSNRSEGDRKSNRVSKDSVYTDGTGGSKRNSTDEKPSNMRKSVAGREGEDPQESGVPGAVPAGQEAIPKVKVSRRKSAAERCGQCELEVMSDAVQPFSQVEVRWKLKGVKTNEADWLGMYEGVEIPDDIDNYASSMMATGKAQGSVKFTAPNHPGLHHFRYFLLDDTEAAVSSAFTIMKLDKAEAKEDIRVRDAVLAENEVLRIEGKQVDDSSEEEEEIVTPEGVVKKKKKKKDGPKEYDDVTGFEVDENSTTTGAEQHEKWKVEDQKKRDEASESMMHEATNYTKKIPTKKEMRAAAAAKLAKDLGQAPNRASTEEAAPGGGAPKKKSGWGAVRSAVKATSGFQQGRANKADDNFKNRKKGGGGGGAGGGGEDMGSFVINRGKR